MPTTIRCWTSSPEARRDHQGPHHRQQPRVRSMTCPTSSPSAATAPWTWSMSTAASLLCSRTPPAETATAPRAGLLWRDDRQAAPPQVLPAGAVNNKVNLDQLLAINNAMRYPLAYVRGPPGTGRTSTIVNTLTTAFFNERTVLFPATTTIPLTALWKSCRPSPTTARPFTIPDPAPWQQRENRRGPAPSTSCLSSAKNPRAGAAAGQNTRTARPAPNN